MDAAQAKRDMTSDLYKLFQSVSVTRMTKLGNWHLC
jgi:hypothetical protein